MRTEDLRTFLIFTAAQSLGEDLYIWGGDDEDEGGYDCSGRVSRWLQEVNRVYPTFYAGGRETARGLHAYFEKQGCQEINAAEQLRPGCLVFYRSRPTRPIHHVALHAFTLTSQLVGKGRMAEFGPLSFESGGAGSRATTPREALLRSAGTRMTASDNHGSAQWLALDPFSLLPSS